MRAVTEMEGFNSHLNMEQMNKVIQQIGRAVSRTHASACTIYPQAGLLTPLSGADFAERHVQQVGGGRQASANW